MAMIAPDAEVERVELAPAAALFRSLGDPARLVIVRRLAVGPARVTALTAALGVGRSPGSHTPRWPPCLPQPSRCWPPQATPSPYARNGAWTPAVLSRRDHRPPG